MHYHYPDIFLEIKIEYVYVIVIISSYFKSL